MRKLLLKPIKKRFKNLEGNENSCTFASAFAQKRVICEKERVLWKIYIDRSSTRSEYLYCYRYLGRKKRTVNLVRSRKQPRRIWKGAFNLIHWIVVLRQIISGIASLTSDTVEDTNLYNEEFDPGSGWTLATGLTHASRGAARRKLAFFVGDRRTGE